MPKIITNPKYFENPSDQYCVYRPDGYEIDSIRKVTCAERKPWGAVVATETAPWKIGRVIYTHVPKTGGMWLTRTGNQRGIWTVVGDGHFPRRYLDWEFKQDCAVVAAARHPLTWLRSWWTYHNKKVINVKGKPERIVRTWNALTSNFQPNQVMEMQWQEFDFGSFYDEEWNLFLSRVMKWRPDIWQCCLKFFMESPDPDDAPTIIIHQENLQEEFAEVVDRFHLDNPQYAENIRKMNGEMNVTRDKNVNWGQLFPKQIREDFYAANMEYIKKCGYENELW